MNATSMRRIDFFKATRFYSFFEACFDRPGGVPFTVVKSSEESAPESIEDELWIAVPYADLVGVLGCRGHGDIWGISGRYYGMLWPANNEQRDNWGGVPFTFNESIVGL